MNPANSCYQGHYHSNWTECSRYVEHNALHTESQSWPKLLPEWQHLLLYLPFGLGIPWWMNSWGLQNEHHCRFSKREGTKSIVNRRGWRPNDIENYFKFCSFNQSKMYLISKTSLTSKYLYFTQTQDSVMIQVDGEKSTRMNLWALNVTCFTFF